MNIKIYTNNTEPPNYHSPASATDRAKPAVGTSAGDYDKATFNKPSEPIDGSIFARLVAHETAGRLERNDNQEKIERLKQQVATGSYQPNAKKIAERILGYR